MKDMVTLMLNSEMDETLGYSKYDRNSNNNYIRQGLKSLNGLSFYLTENYTLSESQEYFKYGLNVLYIF